MATNIFNIILTCSSLISWNGVIGYHGTDENFLDGPRFLPNSLEVEVEVTTLQPTSVYYMAKCDGVWLEFVLTACNYETLWHASIDFYDLKKGSSQSPSGPMNENNIINNPQQSQSEQIHSWSAGRMPEATLINQFHRKIIRVDPEQSREGAYRLTLSGFMRNTTVRVFTSESEESNYKSVFYPTSNTTSEKWTALLKSNHLKNMWLSWPKMDPIYEQLGSHLTCLTVVTYNAFDRCSSCAYSSMQDLDNYGKCVKPLFKKCSTNYNYEPYLPSELRYEKEKPVGLISKEHPITKLITPYFQQLIPPVDFKEVATPFMLRYVSLRPLESIKVDITEVRNMQWFNVYLLVQACYSAVRVRVDSQKMKVKDHLEVFEVKPHSSIRLINGRRHEMVAMRYFFTDDVSQHNPLSFTSKTQIHKDSAKSTCTSLTIALYHSQPNTHYCVIATEMNTQQPHDYKLSDYETSKCMNPIRDVNVPEKRSWESCKITHDESFFALDSFRKIEIVLSGLLPQSNLAVEVFAMPTNNFYALHVWSKVGDIFNAKTANC